MRVTISGKSAQLDEREREYADKKLQRLSRYFSSAREAHLTYGKLRNWHVVEVQLDLDGTLLRAEERRDDARAAIDAVSDKLEQQVRRLKEKIKHRKGRANAHTVASLLAEAPDGEDLNGEEASLPGVVRQKRFAIRPMTVEEASLQIDLLNHDFFVFLNADTAEVNVLYRRREGDYGLLEVEA